MKVFVGASVLVNVGGSVGNRVELGTMLGFGVDVAIFLTTGFIVGVKVGVGACVFVNVGGRVGKPVEVGRRVGFRVDVAIFLTGGVAERVVVGVGACVFVSVTVRVGRGVWVRVGVRVMVAVFLGVADAFGVPVNARVAVDSGVRLPDWAVPMIGKGSVVWPADRVGTVEFVNVGMAVFVKTGTDDGVRVGEAVGLGAIPARLVISGCP